MNERIITDVTNESFDVFRMFDKQWDGKPIVRLRMAKNDCQVVLDGQVSLFEGGGGE